MMAVFVGGPITAGGNVNEEGISASSTTGEAVHADTRSSGTAAIAAYNLAPDGTGAAIYAKKEGSNGHAGFFDGDVHVTRSVTVEVDIMLSNSDCAEEFDLEVSSPDEPLPGSVMVIGDEGSVRLSTSAYDKRVAGVISGAGTFEPGIILDRRNSDCWRPAVALMGKVFCKADTTNGPIEVGDLLTTSGTAGHAMKAADPLKAFGAVLGKALRPLKEGQGLIPVLVALQ